MNVQNISFAANQENSAFSNFSNKKEQLKNNEAAKEANVPSYTREAVKFGVAFPFTYYTGKLAYLLIKAKKSGKKFLEVLGENKVKEETAKNTNKIISKLNKHRGILGLTAAGIGTGLLIKNQLDKHPDNKILRAIDTAGSCLGI